MGLHPRTFTVLFVLGRLHAWVVQWRETINGPAFRDLPYATLTRQHLTR